MAKVFLVQGGGQRGGSIAEVPWPDCVELFGLDDMSRTEDRPKFGDGDGPSIFPTHMVVQIEEDEAKLYRAEPGFFVSPLQAEKARRRLRDFQDQKGQK